MKIPVFVGSSVAIVTPFKDGKVDFKALQKLIYIQKIAGTAAITVCGTTGEAVTMTPEERYNVIAFTKVHSDGMTVIAGAGANSTEAALKNALSAQSAGADALLIVTPYYNKTTQSGLVKHYTYIADRVTKPIILYNVPSRTGLSFTAETYRELSKHERINGVKEASGSFSLVTQTLRECGDDLNIWSGNDDIIVPMMSLGAKGVISVAANIIPSEIRAMTDMCLNGDFKSASAMQIKYSPLIDALFSEVNPIPVKAALSRMNLCENELRLPLVPMSKSKAQVLYSEMDKLI